MAINRRAAQLFAALSPAALTTIATVPTGEKWELREITWGNYDAANGKGWLYVFIAGVQLLLDYIELNGYVTAGHSSERRACYTTFNAGDVFKTQTGGGVTHMGVIGAGIIVSPV